MNNYTLHDKKMCNHCCKNSYTPNYCNSIESILKSESQISKCNEELFTCEIINWLNCIPDCDKRIKLYTDTMDALTNRLCCLSELICASSKLLKCCDNDIKTGKAKHVKDCCYILEKCIYIHTASNTETMHYLIYDSKCNKVFLENYDSKYDNNDIKLGVYVI
ncbi:MAG: hypothetical protein RR620_12700 [Clostridium sp.]|uniref:hypothetical protein n=1 Tax=Anaerorhabdus sp. TaxID=1872524 RepID=UPI002FC6CDDB